MKLDLSKNDTCFSGLDINITPKRYYLSICWKRLDIFLIISSNNKTDVINAIKIFKPKVLAIDAPLSLTNKPFRTQELKAIRNGAKLLPLTIKHIRSLHYFAKKIIGEVKKLKLNIEIVETHPTSVAMFLGYTNTHNLVKRKGILLENKHEKDSITACILANMYFEGKTKNYGGKYPFVLPIKQKDHA